MAANITDKLIKQSNGTQPLPTTLSAQKNAGATTASLNSATGWDTTTAKHIRMYKTKVVNGQTVPDWDYVCFYKATLSGTTLSDLTLVWSSTGSDQTFALGDTVDLSYTSGYGEDLYSALSAHLDQDGTLKADSVDVTAVIKDAIITPAKFNSRTKLGWFDGELPAVSSVTYNGNRSYTVSFASTVASILSEGMRLEFTKTVAGNGYMGGAFNGSSHYFTKTSPSGTLGTVTNNFTIEWCGQITTYQQCGLAGRADASFNNAAVLRMESDGRASVTVANAGAANYRTVATYQSLPLNKKTHIAVSWTSGTVVIYFDGISVPVAAATTGGTAPTTAGSDGDFSIGRPGAYAGQYLSGYASNCAVFDAVLTAATIKQHATYKLLGSETNCIGAWSLDNTANDQSSAGNNLTATGGVGYTAMSPHGQLGDAVQTTKAVGLVMAVSGTDVTVQCPEGVTIPTTGGITSVAYSTQSCPFGFVSDKGRWGLLAQYNNSLSQTNPANGTWYNPSSYLQVFKGGWELDYGCVVEHSNTNTTPSMYTTLSTGNNSETDKRFTGYIFANSNNYTTSGTISRSNGIRVTNTSDTYYLNFKTDVTAAASTIYLRGDKGATVITAIPSGL